MKVLRLFVLALMAICFFGSAKAQVVLRARVGGPAYHRGYHHHHHYHHYHHYHRR